MIDCVMEYTNDKISSNSDVSSADFMYEALLNEGHDARLLRFAPSDDETIEGGHTDPKNVADWIVGCLGITSPCSDACEKAFISCVDSKDVSTAEARSESFAECNGNRPTDCTADCAPTYDMLIESEAPIETKFTTFGAVAGDRDPKPSTSLCSVQGKNVVHIAPSWLLY